MHAYPTDQTSLCRRCKLVKPVGEFSIRHRKTKTRADSYCKACYLARWHIWNQKKEADHRHTANLRRYNLTKDAYLAMHKSQNGRCAICKQKEYIRPSRGDTKQRRLSVDHCHATGVVRSLLCSSCNRGLGIFRENPELLRSAADYIEKHCTT